MKEKYFAASNSEKGFVSYFGEIFNPTRFRRIYIIKGGPGTGKSYFMKKIAEEAERNKRKITLYFCSSDQNSLDGITIDDEIAILDGTPPHAVDAKFPGAVEEIVNLGAFWDPDKLTGHLDEIMNLSEMKKEKYTLAYETLSAYGALCGLTEKYIEDVLDKEKVKKTVKRLLAKHQIREDAYRKKICPIDSIGMEGRVRFDTFEERANRIVYVKDVLSIEYGVSSLFMKELLKALEELKISVSFSTDAIVPSRINRIFIEGDGTVFTTKKTDFADKTVSCAGFFESDNLNELKKNLKKINLSISEMEKMAISLFLDIKKIHFEIEEIYKSAMNFEAKEAFTEQFLKKLFGEC